jgi:hypothetical protein
MQEAYPEVPRAKKYPLEGILDMLGDRENHFLSSSVPQAMALAAYLGTYSRVEVYGVAMETNTEYQFQREGVSFWVGFLKGRGIDVYFADPTFQCPIYGYEGEVSIKYERFAERIAELNPELARLTPIYRAALATANAALEAFSADSSKVNETALMEAVHKQVSIGQELGWVDGAIQENMRYKDKADKMREAAEGEFVFSRQEFESAAKNMTDQEQHAQTLFVAEGTKLGMLHDAIMHSAKGSPKRAKAMEAFRQVQTSYLQIANRGAIFKGAARENFGYMALLDKHIRAAGGAMSEAVLLEQAQAVLDA